MTHPIPPGVAVRRPGSRATWAARATFNVSSPLQVVRWQQVEGRGSDQVLLALGALLNPSGGFQSMGVPPNHPFPDGDFD